MDHNSLLPVLPCKASTVLGAHHYERFGLNTRQIELISRATPKRDYYYQSPLGARVFDLGLGPIALSVCGASSPENQARMDRIWAETEGDGFAACWLIEKGLPWAAELLTRWPGHAPEAADPIQSVHAIAAE